MNKDSEDHVLKNPAVEGFTHLSNSPKPDLSASSKQKFITEVAQLARQGSSLELQDLLKRAEEEAYRQGHFDGQQRGYHTGKAESYEAGFKDGIEISKNTFEVCLDLLEKTRKTYQTAKDKLIDEARPEIIRFCMTICKAILLEQLKDPQTFLKHIETLIQQAEISLKGSSINLSISSSDYEMLQKAALATNEEFSLKFNSLKFSVDPTLPRGCCRLESLTGLVNFDIHRVLEDLERKVLEKDIS
jgi:flagellar biosynthesis/type III secretory pathway protein FliH